MIQFITHSNNRYGYVDGARLALEGGCRWVQLRMKEATETEFMAAAAEIGRLCKGAWCYVCSRRPCGMGREDWSRWRASWQKRYAY